jgi:hypothetical protein
MLVNFQTGITQTTQLDSLKIANNELDAQIIEKIKLYELDSIDFILLRVYDTLIAENNRCTFMISQDSCTKRFVLAVDYDLTIHHISIGYPTEHYHKKCFEKMPEVESNLRLFQNYFKLMPPGLPKFKDNPCTFYGQISGDYLLETFDTDFLNTFHSGMLYDTICSYMGVWCDND